MPPIPSPRRSTFLPQSMVRPVSIPGKAPAPIDSAGAGAYHNSNETSPGSSYTGSLSNGRHPAPYMVALSGWPEPVYVAEARETWEKRRSRPPSPTGFGFSHLREGGGGAREMHDGARLPPLGGQEFRDGLGAAVRPDISDGPNGPYVGSRGGGGAGMTRTASASVDPSMRSSRPSSPASSTFPTSSARGTASPEAPSPSGTSTAGSTDRERERERAERERERERGPDRDHGGPSRQPPTTAAAAAAATAAAAARVRRYPSGFTDPRYGRNASVVGAARAALRVAPAWSQSSSSSSASLHASSVHGAQPYPGPAGTSASGAGRGGMMRGAPPSHPAAYPAQHLARARSGVLVTPLSLVQRATPEVWPPPKYHHHQQQHHHDSPASSSAGAASPHLVTELYPRDPDSPWMWKAPSPANGGSTNAPSHSAHSHSHPHPSHSHAHAHANTTHAHHSRGHSVGGRSRGSASASASPKPASEHEGKEEKMDVDH